MGNIARLVLCAGKCSSYSISMPSLFSKMSRMALMLFTAMAMCSIRLNFMGGSWRSEVGWSSQSRLGVLQTELLPRRWETRRAEGERDYDSAEPDAEGADVEP